MSSTTSWSEANDQKLWSLRYKPTSQLASTFNETQGTIRSRIKHLNDPNHKAYRRRIKNGIAPLPSTAARKQSAINMMASPFATGYLAASEALSSQKRSSSTNSNNNISNKKSKVQNSSINGGGGVIDLCDSSDDDLLSSLATKKKSSVSTSSSFTSTAAKRTSNTNTIGASSFAANYLAAKLSSSSSNSTSSSNARTKSTNNNGRIDPSTLNTDQQSASKYIFSGGNAFLTG